MMQSIRKGLSVWLAGCLLLVFSVSANAASVTKQVYGEIEIAQIAVSLTPGDGQLTVKFPSKPDELEVDSYELTILKVNDYTPSSPVVLTGSAISAENTTYVFNKLTNKMTYTVKVTGFKDGEIVAQGSASSAPDKPKIDISLTPGDGQLTLKFPSKTEKLEVDSYELKIGLNIRALSSPIVLKGSAITAVNTTYVFKKLTNQVYYTVQVTGIKNGKIVVQGTAVSAPSKPKIDITLTPGDGQLTVKFPSKTADLKVDSYELTIQNVKDPKLKVSSPIVLTGSAITAVNTTYAFKKLTNQKAYTVQVTGFKDGKPVAQGTATSAPDKPKINVTLTPGDKQLTVKFPSKTADLVVDTYKLTIQLVKNPKPTSPVVLTGSSISAENTTYVFKKLFNQMTYTVQVAGFKDGKLVVTGTASSEPVWPKLEGLSIVAGDKQVTVTFKKIAIASKLPTTYKIEWWYRTASNGAPISEEPVDVQATFSDTKNLSYIFESLKNGTSYHFTVTAMNNNDVLAVNSNVIAIPKAPTKP
jgi:hypothetical protein